MINNNDNMNNDNIDISSSDVFDDDIYYWIDRYCEEFSIDSLDNISDNKWTDILIYIYKHMFKGNNRLKVGNIYSGNLRYGSTYNCNAYDKNKVNDVLDTYIELCYRYNKRISITGFSLLTGINNNTFHQWKFDNSTDNNIYNNSVDDSINNNSSNNNSVSDGGDVKRPSTTGNDIYKKLRINAENLLANRLNGGGNVIGIQHELNARYGWATPQALEEQTDRSQARLSRDVLAADMAGFLPDKSDIIDAPNST